eukprot:2928588-Amphidinium_carterae.1
MLRYMSSVAVSLPNTRTCSVTFPAGYVMPGRLTWMPVFFPTYTWIGGSHGAPAGYSLPPRRGWGSWVLQACQGTDLPPHWGKACTSCRPAMVWHCRWDLVAHSTVSP